MCRIRRETEQSSDYPEAKKKTFARKKTNESNLLYLRLKCIVKNCITIKIHILICYKFFKKIKIDAE
jgi:hypothetical protein